MCSNLFHYYIKQINSMLPCICSVIDHRRRPYVVRTLVTHSATPRVPLFRSYHILMSSVIYIYWTDARQHGIYLLIRKDRFTVGKIRILHVTGFETAWTSVVRICKKLTPSHVHVMWRMQYFKEVIKLNSLWNTYVHCSLSFIRSQWQGFKSLLII